METITLKYRYRYTTKGGKDRYTPVGKPRINLGDVYLCGMAHAPRRLTIIIESDE